MQAMMHVIAAAVSPTATYEHFESLAVYAVTTGFEDRKTSESEVGSSFPSRAATFCTTIDHVTADHGQLELMLMI